MSAKVDDFEQLDVVDKHVVDDVNDVSEDFDFLFDVDDFDERDDHDRRFNRHDIDDDDAANFDDGRDGSADTRKIAVHRS